MKRIPLVLLVVAVFSVIAARAQTAPAAILAIRVDEPGVAISPDLVGIFFEEINNSGDGGLYAELVQNRSFEEPDSTASWQLVTTGPGVGTMTADTTSAPLNPSNPTSLRLAQSSASGTVGVANGGFWGMNLVAGKTYDLTFLARRDAASADALAIRLESADSGAILAQTSRDGLTTAWSKFSVTLTPATTVANGRLVIALSTPGTVWLDRVSLFPRDTFHGRANGMRPELATPLEDLRPAFMRFPGGCWVEGVSMAEAYRWKQTIGPVEYRRTQHNLWGYYSNNGLGYHEYLQLCEDIGADPLFVINCGMSHTDVVPLADLGEYVQDALDAIEYANGAITTSWGAQRAANGHPEPFNLRYLQVGNENGGTNYNDRYAVFYDAVKAAHPGIKIISCVWGGTPTSRPLEIIDEHYYNNAGFFVANANKYDGYNRAGPKIYVGEYAVTSGPGKGNLMGALGEAAFMTGMERNADIVAMSSYAPLYGNVNRMAWTPDLIYFDSSRVAPTPSYHVQKMFSRNLGDLVLPATLTVTGSVPNPPPHGGIGVGSWLTSVEYENVVVTRDGSILYQSDFAGQGSAGWNAYNGSWSVAGGIYRQTSASATDCRSTAGDTSWANYTLSLRARKVSGGEGFLILFNRQDDNNFTWLNLGGWGNQQHGIEYCVNGSKTSLGTRTSGSIVTGQWYDISIVLSGSRIQCYLDGALIQDVNYPANADSGLFTATSYQKSTGEIIVKAVNPYGVAMPTTLTLTGVEAIAPEATLVQMSSGNATAANTVAAPAAVAPVSSVITHAGTTFGITFPANSLSVLRLRATGPRFVTGLRLEAPVSIAGGSSSPTTVWGRIAGRAEEINLTGDPRYGITHLSSNPGVAGVDAGGTLTGLGEGTTTIIATYASLGISATQTVRVIGAPITLLHRYRFDETGGSTVADSAGGPAWDGTVPNGGTFGGGRLGLAGARRQFVNLPAGLLTGYRAVTIDAWATFGTLPAACFFYGFGNSSGATGVDYIFCQPRQGRIAVSDSDWHGEQGAGGGGDWSGRTVHVTAVYNPPSGYVELYVNGVRISRNSAVTVPLSSIDNVFSYIGRSLYSADAYMDVSLDEFRIYDGALSPADIAAAESLGPDLLPVATSSDIVVTPDPRATRGAWEGWGVSLAWWANVFGKRDDLADLMFTTDYVRLNEQTLPGLGLGIARYNAGASGGNSLGGMTMQTSPNIPAYKQMETLWLDGVSADPASASWAWTADANQRAMLLKARARGVDRMELFSNSPPWWMCVNSNPSGSADGAADNLGAAWRQAQAVYLASVARRAADDWGVVFDTIAPFNEPMGTWWRADGGQEGCHYEIGSQAEMLGHLRAQLDVRGLASTRIAASDEAFYDQATGTWSGFATTTQDLVGRLNVHGYQYGEGRRDLLAQATAARGLAISEYSDDDASGLSLASNLNLDFRLLRPVSWCYWQPFDVGGWGLVEADPGERWIGAPNPKYYLLAHYTRHIRPGMTILDGGEAGTITAYDATTRKLAIVTLNTGPARMITYNLAGFYNAAGPVRRWVTMTGAGAKYEAFAEMVMGEKAFAAYFDTNTIQTFEIENVDIDRLVRLAIAPGPAAGQVLLSWPDWATAYSLYTTTNLAAPTAWTPVAETPALSAGNLTVVFDLAGTPARFFRLAKP